MQPWARRAAASSAAPPSSSGLPTICEYDESLAENPLKNLKIIVINLFKNRQMPPTHRPDRRGHLDEARSVYEHVLGMGGSTALLAETHNNIAMIYASQMVGLIGIGSE